MKVKDIFDVVYGVNLELINCNETSSVSNGVNFVSRTSENNGVVARVLLIDGVTPHESGTISCAVSGSVLSTFVQSEPYYSGRDLYVLTPKIDLKLVEKLFYCYVINANKYRYSYGRAANKTLKDIELPDEIPEWVYKVSLDNYYQKIKTSQIPKELELRIDKWKLFKMDEIFKFSKGKRLTKADMTIGNLNYIGAISDNNGIRQFIEEQPTHKGNCITINYNGSVGEAFYQRDDFWASDDVNVLMLKNQRLNKNIGLFLCTIIKANKYKFGYGRKWTLEKMKSTEIALPIDSASYPDWTFMENFIKQLPYSDKI